MLRIILNLLLFLISNTNCHDYHGWDDSILFKLDWANGDLAKLQENTYPPQDQMKVISADDEPYTCFLPNLEKKQLNDGVQYEGPTPIEILKPLFQESMCTFRLESYWTYEVCHGRYIRQFHEDREGKNIKTQEYFLGMWETSEQTQIINTLKSSKDESKATKRVYGSQLPYYELEMGSGTLCDLNGKPRLTKLLYVCAMNSKLHEVYSLKEISTCEYEIIILTPLLCSHPKYKPKETQENLISCVGTMGHKKPKSLFDLHVENLMLRQQSMLPDDKSKKVYAVFKVDKDGQGGERVRIELRPFEELEDLSKDIKNSESSTKSTPVVSSISDTSPVENFLLGKNCLNGGSGWWKYDFCYGRYIEQYHVEKDGKRTSVNLGKFDKMTHLQWLEKNPHKRPKPVGQRKQLSHFYSDGTICDKTGKPRQTEVKLKCLENTNGAGTVVLYLLEPKSCEYILGVESPIICDIIDKADNNGLVQLEFVEKREYKSKDKEEQSPVKSIKLSGIINE